MIKRIIVLLSSIFACSALSAGTMGSVPSKCSAKDISIACEANKWFIEAQALHFKPSYSNNFANGAAITGGLNGTAAHWDWGYRLIGGYSYDNANELRVSWLDFANKNLTLGLTGNYLQLTGLGPIILTAGYSQLLANKLSQVNFDNGHKLAFTEKSIANFMTGLQYTRLRVDHINYFNVSPAAAIATQGVSSNNSNDFNGVGPRVGIDYSYQLIPGLNIIANNAVGLLYGTARYDTSTLYGNGLIVSGIYGSKRKIAPEFEAKLGLNFNYQLNNGAFNLEGGYQVLQYWNAIQAMPTITTNPLTNASYGLYGPYLSIKWVGNA